MVEVADYSLEHGLHLANALVYATARHWDAELYTSDDRLGELRNVTVI